MKMRALLLTISVLFFSFHYHGGHEASNVSRVGDRVDQNNNLPAFLKGTHEWADSVMKTLTPEQRIAQLFMVAAYSNKGEDHEAHIKRLIEKYRIGGLIFFQGGPGRQISLLNEYQKKSEVPLMIGMDAEWGLAMRLDSTMEFPRQMTLGAIQDDELIEEMGEEIGRQCRRIGVHVNFAPVLDVNNNRNNPVINERSFGENKYRVAEKGIAYMEGLQKERVLATGKHFPGHGDTEHDSHKTLPVIDHNRKRLDSVELYPFARSIDQGLSSMMVAHLNVPALDSSRQSITTLSEKVVGGLLKDSMGFKGLVFTDALNMNAVSDLYRPGKVDAKALLAGNDVLLFSQDVPAAIDQIQEAIREGRISQKEVDERCRKILMAKEWLGSDQFRPISSKELSHDLNAPKAKALQRELVSNALTVLRNKDSVLPIRNVEQDIASLVIGTDTSNAFQRSLDRYGEVDRFSLPKEFSNTVGENVRKELEGYDVVIVSIHGTSRSPYRDFGITTRTVEFVRKLQDLPGKLILDVFANPYSLSKFYGAQNVDGLIVSYEDDRVFRDLSGQLIFGGVRVSGKLPVTANSFFKEGDGHEWDRKIRFKYTYPEEVGISSNDLEKIDSIAKFGIERQAYPGCQIFIAKDDKVIYNKSFGHHTYENQKEVRNSDLYDLASVTKIMASTASLMYLQDSGVVDVDRSLCDYIPDMVDTCGYQNVNLRDILTHRAGLKPWIPFYKETLHHGKPDYEIYSTERTPKYKYRVADELYINKHYRDSIYKMILSANISKDKEYQYSDLGYYLLMEIIERQAGLSIDSFVKKTFYGPLGLQTMGYKPRKRFPLDRIIPTEYDMYFRKQLVHGDVHDPGAAMLGGIGGHAGLFSNAHDVGVMLQMFLNWGEYGGKRYISEETVKEFIQCQFCGIDTVDNRRGVGFDKPVRDGGPGPTCHCVSYDSFGHSGFTGTIGWADPDKDIVYVFLSNRVYPTAKNRKLIELDIRTKIQQVIYDSLSGSSESSNNGQS